MDHADRRMLKGPSEIRAEEILAAYKEAFQDFGEEERLLLDGVDLEPEVR